MARFSIEFTGNCPHCGHHVEGCETDAERERCHWLHPEIKLEAWEYEEMILSGTGPRIKFRDGNNG